MKKLFILSAVALLGATPSKSTAQVLDYQYPSGESSFGESIVADKYGNVFCGGYGLDKSGVPQGLVMTTTDPCASWSIYDNTVALGYPTDVLGLALDASGNLYSIGYLTTSSSGLATDGWYVRQWSAESGIWSTVDDFHYPSATSGYAYGIAADNTGNVYVVGAADTSSGNRWLVRHSPNGTLGSWTNMDDEILPGNYTPRKVAFVPGAGLFIVGTPALGDWIVRRSPAGATMGQKGTWSTVDGPFASGAAWAVCGDLKGNVYVSGLLYTNNNGKGTDYYAWVTRESSNGGTKWTTVDMYRYPGAPTQQASAQASFADSLGNVFVVGAAEDASNQQHWIVRTPSSSGVWGPFADLGTGVMGGVYGMGVAEDAAGYLLVTGTVHDSAGYHWVVWRLAP